MPLPRHPLNCQPQSSQNLSRRRFIGGVSTLPLLGSTQLSFAEMTLGSSTLTTVSDGHLVLPGDFIFGPMPQNELAPLLTEFGLSPTRLEPECNLALLRDGERNILFDVGSGSDFAPTAGSVLDSLDALGLAPEDITHVIFTHGHPDHLWGVIDDFDDPLFTEAQHLMGRAEWDYWWNPETVNTIATERTTMAVGAKRRMEVIEDMMNFFDDGDEVLPGVSAISSPGHTPGHMSFEVRQGAQAALITGDAIGNHHVAFRRPAWISGSDQDGELGAKTRVALLDRIKADDLAVVGFHLPHGGMGRLETTTDGFNFIPDNAT